MATTKILGLEITALSASYATTSSFALAVAGGGGAAFPFTGSALITGSLTVTGSLVVTAGITGSLQGTASYATQALSASFAPSNPKLLSFTGITGSNSVSNSVTICHSVLLPANTLGTNNILQLVLRIKRITNTAGQVFARIYVNTSNSLSGATLISPAFTINGGGAQNMAYCERNYSYDGTTLTTYVSTTLSDYSTGTIQTTTFNRTVNQYILFTIQSNTATDVSNIDLYKVFLYA